MEKIQEIETRGELDSLACDCANAQIDIENIKDSQEYRMAKSVMESYERKIKYLEITVERYRNEILLSDALTR